MYGWSRIDEGFGDEVDKFIEATEKHALTLTHYKDIIICPCKDCKNLMAFVDLNTIRSHLIMRVTLVPTRDLNTIADITYVA